ncbi:MAG: cytochrome c oxidase assembly factor Coa1 family protein [Janthinobacterium lividum]
MGASTTTRNIQDHPSCSGCGTLLEPTEDQVNQAVDEVFTASLADAHKARGVCPLCGLAQAVPFWNRRTVLFGLFAICLLAIAVNTATRYRTFRTERMAAASDALAQARKSSAAVQLIGAPIVLLPGLDGSVTHDETGWTEVRLSIPVRGPKGTGVLQAIGGHEGISGPWVFSPFDLIVGEQYKRVDLVSGRIRFAEPDGYLELHAAAALRPEYLSTGVPVARMDGTYPCVAATVTAGLPQASLGRCGTPVGQEQSVDRFTVDLRYGAFVLQQSDLAVAPAKVAFNRSYRSDDWLGANRSHAFGRNSNHPFDVALIGARNPYTYVDLVLEDGEFLRFDRISRGTGYADAVYLHSETSTRFYKATVRWNGHGWTLDLADGSRIEFPESYNATNLAQGAPRSMVDASGREITLRRDKQRNLLSVEADRPLLNLTYDKEARIVRAEGTEGSWASYTYQGGLLTDVVLSSGVERHYCYEGNLMTSISDEHGRMLLRNTYENGQVVRQEYAGGFVYKYAYTLDTTRHYVKKVVVTSPDQSLREVTVDSVPESVRAGLPA